MGPAFEVVAPLDQWLALSLEDVARLIRLRRRLRLPPVVDGPQLEALLGPLSGGVFEAFAVASPGGGPRVVSVFSVLCGCVLASHGGGFDAKARLLYRLFDMETCV